MEQVLDEIKQYVIAKITLNNSGEDYSLIKGKKYICVKYDDDGQFINIIYAGKFKYYGNLSSGMYLSHVDYGGYIFDGEIEDKNNSINIIIASEYNDILFEFYEIEESFDANRIKQIFYTIKYWDDSIKIIIGNYKIEISNNYLKIKS